MRNMRVLMACAVIACGTLVSQQTAQANTLLPTFLGKANLGGGLYRYDYNVTLDGASTGSNIKADLNNFFTMYDFAGMVGATVNTTSAGTWSSTLVATGQTPAGTTPVDTGALNATFTYDSGPGQAAVVPSVFTFSIFSTKGTVSATKNVQYTGQDYDGDGVLQGNIGKVVGAAAVPELGTLPLFGGLIGLGGLAIRKRRAI